MADVHFLPGWTAALGILYSYREFRADLLTPLRRYWGYDAFRPLQERIVRSLLDGRTLAS